MLTRFVRDSASRPLPFLDSAGEHFQYSPADVLMREVEELGMRLGGSLVSTHPVRLDAQSRDRYLVRSLMEESITSSQLEGAATTRAVAKEMLRTQRPPRNRGEQMIANNYAAMSLLRERVDEPLTESLLLELHEVLTKGTLDDPSAAGRIQRPDEDRVIVGAMEGNMLHQPPPAHELPERLQRLLDFANRRGDDVWVPGLLRPITLHFMVGFDHYFVDGNGRLARALFYWSMLKEGFWLSEFVSISQLLRQAPVQYGRAYLYAEQESDVTYFQLHQLRVLRKAVEALEGYVRSKAEMERRTVERLADLRHSFNRRQVAVIAKAARDRSTVFTVQSHATSQAVSLPTAQRDLDVLTKEGYLTKTQRGRRYEWTPGPAIVDGFA